MTHPSFTSSLCCATSLSVILPAPSVCPMTRPHVIMSIHHTDMSVCHTTRQSICQATRKSVTLSVRTMASPSIIPVHPSYDLSIHHPVNSSMTCPSVTPPISPTICLSDCPTSSDRSSTIYTSLSDNLSCPSPSDSLYDKPTSPSACPSPPDRLYNEPPSRSACPSLSDSLTTTTTHPTICPSLHTIHRTQDSIQSLAVMNGEQSHKVKKFRKAFTSYDLLLHALDVSRIYLSDSRCVAPPKSGEDAHVTHGRCDLGGTTLNKPRLGFSYVLPRPWDSGGVRSTPDVPRDRSRTLAPSRYPYAPCRVT